MKKVSFFIVAALFAASSVFVSCSKDEEPEPTDPPVITVKLNGVEQSSVTVEVGETVEFLIEITADAGFKEVTIKRNGENLDGYPQTPLGKTFSESFDITYTGAGTDNFSVAMTDKEDRDASKPFTIKVDPNPLSEAKEFTLTYVNASQTNGLNENKEVGIKYAINTNETTARFEIVATTDNFVPLTKQEFDAITNKQALIKKYDDDVETKGVNSFTRESDAKFQAYYFISKVDEKYFLVEMKSLKFVPGDNKAVFSYRE